jgi:hypothetical protein
VKNYILRVLARWLRKQMINEFAYELTAHELQSRTNRVDHAEGLILQLDPKHEGRNTWLLNYGKKEDARKKRQEHRYSGRRLNWCDRTQALETVGGK